MRGQIEGQMSIFDFIEKPKPIENHLPCDTCGHDIKGCCDYDYINNHDYCVLGDKWIPKAPDRVPPVHRYLRYRPHTLIPEVREETKNWLDKNGVPEWVTWDKNSVPCSNCTWFDGRNCCSGGHTNHYEYGYLICDGFYQSCVERKPSTVGEGLPNGIKQEPHIYPLDIRGICDDPYCPQCGYPFETIKTCKNYEVDCERCPECHVKVDWTPWHRLNDEENAGLEHVTLEELNKKITEKIGIKFKENPKYPGEYVAKIKGGYTLEFSFSTYMTEDGGDGKKTILLGWSNKKGEGGGSPGDSIEEAVDYFKKALRRIEEDKHKN